MATLTTFTAGTTIRSADVNANFVAVNTEVEGATRTGYASSVPVGNIGTGIDTLHSWTMPAGTLSAIGDGLIIRAHFVCAANANAKAINIKIGGINQEINPTTTSPNGKDFVVDLVVTVCNLTAFNNMNTVGTSVIATTLTGTSPALERAFVSAGGVSAGSFASDIVVQFTGTATTTNDIVQQLTYIAVFKA